MTTDAAILNDDARDGDPPAHRRVDASKGDLPEQKESPLNPAETPAMAALKQLEPSTEKQPIPAQAPLNRHVRYLEGLRGLAALVVVFQHIFYHTLADIDLPRWQSNLRDFLSCLFPGRASVDVFIVLSGYLLMRPVARTPDGTMPGGTLAYLRRRARRILPPYYAALGGAILLLLMIPALRQPISEEWFDAVPALQLKTIIAHLLMLHNFSYLWAAKIDPPMWTVATEWQIYFVFPLLLLPVWRKLGNFGAVSCGLILGLGFFLVTGRGHSAAPWFLGLFAFGMAAAARERRHMSSTGSREFDRALFGRLAFWLFAIFWIITALTAMNQLRFISTWGLEGTYPYFWEFDLLAGAASACLLVYSAASLAGKPSPLLGFLSSKPLVQLGVISYSLYLIHDPMLALMKIAMDKIELGPFTQFGAMIVVGIPIVLLITYPFHRIFEKPFMSSGRVKVTS